MLLTSRHPLDWGRGGRNGQVKAEWQRDNRGPLKAFYSRCVSFKQRSMKSNATPDLTPELSAGSGVGSKAFPWPLCPSLSCSSRVMTLRMKWTWKHSACGFSPKPVSNLHQESDRVEATTSASPQQIQGPDSSPRLWQQLRARDSALNTLQARVRNSAI